MNRVRAFICASLVSLCSAYAEDPNAGPAPVLLKAEKVLRAVLADVDPEPLFEYSEHSESLVVKYRTRKFMVHSTTKTGRHSEKAIEVEGPSYEGFQLKIHLQDAGTVNQAVVPQTIRRPYWKTDLDVTLIPATDKQLYWGLSYGARVNKDLLKGVKHAINSLDKRRWMISAPPAVLVPACKTAPKTSAIEAEPTLYPEIEPFETGYFRVSQLHEIYYELSGNPNGRPVFVLHGGPGFAWPAYIHRYFNPDVFLVVKYDQRGAGQSRPFMETRENTTQDLVEDIERLRGHFGLGKVLIFGGSWGTALGLAYAEKYPDHVAGMVLRGVLLPSREHINHAYHGGIAKFFPETYDDFLTSLPDPNRRPIPEYLVELLHTEDPDSPGDYVMALTKYEWKMSFLEAEEPDDVFDIEDLNVLRDSVRKSTRFVLHYVTNNYFLEEGQLLRDATRLIDIPITLINGRYDMNTPPYAAYQLHKILPRSKLIIVEACGHWGDPIVRELLLAMKEFEKRLAVK